MLRVGDSGAQTASVLAFPGKARMLQLREEDCNQETTEFQGSRPEDKDPNSQATIMSVLALPPHILPNFHPVSLYPVLPPCQVSAQVIPCLSQNPSPETKSNKLSYILGPSHPGGHPPCSFRSHKVNTHMRWGLHTSVDDVVSENVPGAQALHTTFPFGAP